MAWTARDSQVSAILALVGLTLVGLLIEQGLLMRFVAERLPDDLIVFHGAILARYYVGEEIESWTTDWRANLDTWLPTGRRVWLLLPRDAPATYETWLEEHGTRVELSSGAAGPGAPTSPAGRR